MSSTAMHKNLIEETGNKVVSAVQQHARDGEGVDFAVSMTVVPGERQNTFVPVLLIALTMDSAVFGNKIMSNILSFDLYMTEDHVSKMVQDQLEAMRAQRSTEIASTGQGIDGFSSTGGLLLPR